MYVIYIYMLVLCVIYSLICVYRKPSLGPVIMELRSSPSSAAPHPRPLRAGDAGSWWQLQSKPREPGEPRARVQSEAELCCPLGGVRQEGRGLPCLGRCSLWACTDCLRPPWPRSTLPRPPIPSPGSGQPQRHPGIALKAPCLENDNISQYAE